MEAKRASKLLDSDFKENSFREVSVPLKKNQASSARKKTRLNEQEQLFDLKTWVNCRTQGMNQIS